MSWGPPHDPYNRVPQKYKDRIPLDKINLRDNVSERAIVDFLVERDKPSEKLKERRAEHRKTVENDEQLKIEYLGQQEHHKKISFQDKLRELLKKAGIEYD